MKRKLYERELSCWVELDEERYLAMRRERQKIYYRMHKRSQCYCRKGQLWLCDGNCDSCPFYKRNEAIFSELSEEGLDEDRLGLFSDDGAEARCCEERLCCKEALDRIAACMPEALVYGQMKLDGQSDEEIAAALGLTRMTLYRRIQKLRRVLETEWGND